MWCPRSAGVTLECLCPFQSGIDDMSDEPTAETPASPPLSTGDIPETFQILSNREPYEHTYDNGDIAVSKPTGGLTTALDGVLQETGGAWIAWGSGDADFDPSVVTDGNEFRPAAGHDDYVLHRLDLSKREVREYYYGYSNQVLWPLCHLETEHVVYDESFWTAYSAVNERFGETVSTDPDGVVWIQDYHLALVPRVVRDGGGDAVTLVHFWHIPWPPVETFETCPQRRALLDGLLANDAVGFHIERYRERFLECVAELVPSAAVETDAGTVRYDGRVTETYVAPVVVDVRASAPPDELRSNPGWQRKKAAYDIDTSKTLAVGVDRLDYTKGLVEKLAALERVFERHPELREELTLVQKVTKSRERIPSYRRYDQRVLERVEAVNARFRTDGWQPVIYINERFDRESLRGLLRAADIGAVASRRDGLNLVAEELVYGTRDDPAVLLLSEFTGAAELLTDGPVRINPFDTRAFAEAIVRAVEMDDEERRHRHDQMLDDIERHSLHRWLDTHVDLFTRRLD